METISFLKEYFLSLERQDKIIAAYIFSDSVTVELYKYIRSERFNERIKREIKKAIKDREISFT